MRLDRFALLLLVTAGSGWGCRAIRDDQETRPLPAPEPPPVVTAAERDERRDEEAPRKSASRPRSDPPSDAPAAAEPAAPPAPAVEAEATSDAGAPAAAEPNAGRTRCLDQCQAALGSCVTGADGGTSLETCRGAFEACKAGCG